MRDRERRWAIRAELKPLIDDVPERLRAIYRRAAVRDIPIAETAAELDSLVERMQDTAENVKGIAS